jgi:enediyne biosynthesis protein E4
MVRRLPWLAIPVLFLVAGVLWSMGAWPFSRGITETPAAKPAEETPGLPRFEDVARARGIDFRHFDCQTDLYLIPETMGSGIAWIDYDNDGWPDLFCMQCAPIPGSEGHSSNLNRPGTAKMYHNNRDGTFTDVTDEIGLGFSGFGMGCDVGDYDNDGYDDLVVTFMWGIRLFHNEPAGNGKRKFVDVTKDSGLNDIHWATSCAWGDIDGDGLLDLYVCNYVEIDPKRHATCTEGPKKIPLICTPSSFPHTTHQLFRNKGKGKFEDISVSSGISSAKPAPGLAVVMIDLDGDGLIDIYVASDLAPAYLFHNKGKGKLEERALLSGCALGPNSQPMAGMGIVTGDLDGSSWPSLFITNYQLNPSVVFLNKGKMRFEEASTPTGLGPPSTTRLKWGAVLFDPDLDGNGDILVANGHVHRNTKLFGSTDDYPQEAQLFLGNGKGKFKDASKQAGPDFLKPRVARGVAVARRRHERRGRAAGTASQRHTDRQQLDQPENLRRRREKQSQRHRRQSHSRGRRQNPVSLDHRRRQLLERQRPPLAHWSRSGHAG